MCSASWSYSCTGTFLRYSPMVDIEEKLCLRPNCVWAFFCRIAISNLCCVASVFSAAFINTRRILKSLHNMLALIAILARISDTGLASIRFSWRLCRRCERRYHLLQEPGRPFIIYDANSLDSFVIWQEACAENYVPHNKVIAIIGIGF